MKNLLALALCAFCLLVGVSSGALPSNSRDQSFTKKRNERSRPLSVNAGNEGGGRSKNRSSTSGSQSLRRSKSSSGGSFNNLRYRRRGDRGSNVPLAALTETCEKEGRSPGGDDGSCDGPEASKPDPGQPVDTSEAKVRSLRTRVASLEASVEKIANPETREILRQAVDVLNSASDIEAGRRRSRNASEQKEELTTSTTTRDQQLQKLEKEISAYQDEIENELAARKNADLAARTLTFRATYTGEKGDKNSAISLKTRYKTAEQVPIEMEKKGEGVWEATVIAPTTDKPSYVYQITKKKKTLYAGKRQIFRSREDENFVEDAIAFFRESEPAPKRPPLLWVPFVKGNLGSLHKVHD